MRRVTKQNKTESKPEVVVAERVNDKTDGDDRGERAGENDDAEKENTADEEGDARVDAGANAEEEGTVDIEPDTTTSEEEEENDPPSSSLLLLSGCMTVSLSEGLFSFTNTSRS